MQEEIFVVILLNIPTTASKVLCEIKEKSHMTWVTVVCNIHLHTAWWFCVQYFHYKQQELALLEPVLQTTWKT
jgi:hypothetical protein